MHTWRISVPLTARVRAAHGYCVGLIHPASLAGPIAVRSTQFGGVDRPSVVRISRGFVLMKDFRQAPLVLPTLAALLAQEFFQLPRQLLTTMQGIRIARMLLILLVVLLAFFETTDVFGDFGIRGQCVRHASIKVAGGRF